MVKACRLLVVAGWIGLGVVLAGATVVRGQTCLDPGRTIFVSGGPGTEGCHTYDSNPTSCGLAFISGGSGPTSCYYDNNAASCNGCGPKNAGLACLNVCQPLSVCAGDPGRIFVGGPETEACHVFDSDPASCNNAFLLSGSGDFTSCFVRSTGNCSGCGPDNQRAGLCVNACFQVAAAPTVSHTMLLVIGVLLSFAGVRMLRTRTMQRSRS